MNEELKPCPFCGGEATIREKYMPLNMSGKKTLISVEIFHHCTQIEGQPHCMSVKQIGRDRESAIKAWNTRVNKSKEI